VTFLSIRRFKFRVRFRRSWPCQVPNSPVPSPPLGRFSFLVHCLAFFFFLGLFGFFFFFFFLRSFFSAPFWLVKAGPPHDVGPIATALLNSCFLFEQGLLRLPPSGSIRPLPAKWKRKLFVPRRTLTFTFFDHGLLHFLTSPFSCPSLNPLQRVMEISLNFPCGL